MHALRILARRSSRAQALAEFALVLPIIILLLAMAIDLGRVFYGWVSIQNAARVGASYAASNADAWETPTDATRQARYATLIQNDLQALNCALGAVPAPAFDDLDADGTYDTGEPVAVALDCQFSLITPIGQTILGPVNLGGEATYPVHYTIVTALPSPPPPPPPPTCTVPGTVGQSRNTARSLWTGASFQSGNLIENGSGNFTVATQSETAGSDIPCTSSMTIAQAVGSTPPPCTKPDADFEGLPATGKAPLTVQFTDTSNSPGCPILTWVWSFEVGSSAVADPSFTFNSPGTYTIKLTVANAAGSSKEEKKNKYIQVSP